MQPPPQLSLKLGGWFEGATAQGSTKLARAPSWFSGSGSYAAGKSYWTPSSTPHHTQHNGGAYLLAHARQPSGWMSSLADLEETEAAEALVDAWDQAWFGCTDPTDAPRPSRYSPAVGYADRYQSGSLHAGLTSPSPPLPPHAPAHKPLQTQGTTTSYFSSGTTLMDLQSSAGTIAGTSSGSKQPGSSQESSSQDPGQQRSPASASPAGTAYHQASTLQAKSISLPRDLPSVLASSMLQAEHKRQNGSILLLPPGSTEQPEQPVADAASTANGSTIHINGGTGSKVHGDGQAAAMLGTWVNRQYRLLDPIQEKARQSPPSSSIANAANSFKQPPLSPPCNTQEGYGPSPEQQQTALDKQQQQQQQQHYASVFERPPAAAIAAIAGMMPPTQEQPVPAGASTGGGGTLSECGSDVAAEAAWRWRFTRRWQAEQQRAVCQPEGAGSVDKTEEALQYLQAGGGMGWNMQVGVARTQSTDVSALHSCGTQGHGSLLAGEMLLEDSFNNSGSLARAAGARGALGEETATRHVNSINRRAQQLLEQQAELERAAQARWASTMSAHTGEEAWVGHHLGTVEIDDWGTFRFLVLRVRGRADRQRILVRGRNYCSEGQITEEVNHKMIQLAAQTGCHVESVEVMGGGVMEWRRERDRHLHLHAGWAAQPALASAGGRPTCGQEVLNLAAVLTKQHLPVHFKVSIEGSP